MLVFIIIVSVSLLICCAVFIIAQVMALRKPPQTSDLAIVRSGHDQPLPQDQEPTRFVSSTARRSATAAGASRTRARPGKPRATRPDDIASEDAPTQYRPGAGHKSKTSDPDEARTVLNPRRSDGRPAPATPIRKRSAREDPD